ncbi:MAG: hypothetical protein KGM24_10010 [Elusimicrobia bacterium]|nr:hypothetical protein [Elusimicrobiota bacterium]
MVRLLLAASFVSHLFFLVGGMVEMAPPDEDALLEPEKAAGLFGVQLAGLIVVCLAAFGAGGLGGTLAKWLTLPLLAAHGWAFALYRSRRDAAKGSPALRRFEDALYAAHVLVAAAALIGAALV